MTGRPWRAAKDGLLVSVRVTPRGGRDAWGAGSPEHFAVRVAAAPTDGSANDAVRALAARHFTVARGAVTIHSGERSSAPKSGRMRRIGRYSGSVIFCSAFQTVRTKSLCVLMTLNAISHDSTAWITMTHQTRLSSNWTI